VECLKWYSTCLAPASEHEALSSNPSTKKTNQKQKQTKNQPTKQKLNNKKPIYYGPGGIMS
jgi:hypothetical protein